VSAAPAGGQGPAVPGLGATWPRAVLFDLDGTLADSFAAIAAALDAALAAHGLKPRGLAWTQRHVGRGAVALVADAIGAGADEGTARRVERWFGRRYQATFLKATPPIEGALEVVRVMATRTGGRVGVVSNKRVRLTRSWLRHWGFARFVATVVGPETSGVRKPDPTALAPALKSLGVGPGEALLVGDMDVDVATGRAAGVPVVAVQGVTSTAPELARAGAVTVLAGIRELPAWLNARSQPSGHGYGVLGLP